MIEIKTSNFCTVTNCPAEVVAVAKKVLSIKNPAYERICRITSSRFTAQEYYKYYTEKDGVLTFPRGFRTRFKAYLDKHSLLYREDCAFVDAPTRDFRLFKPVDLRDYQIPLVEGILGHTEGIIEAGTGSGKTVMACEIVRRLGQVTTILVPTTVIQDQFIAEFKKWFNYDVGVINAKVKEIKPVTVAMYQSLSSNKELCQRLALQTGILIVDECHGVISKERSKLVRMFKPSYLYGMSGSNRRSKDDGRTEAIFFYLGQVIAEYKLTQVKPTVEVIRTGVEIPVSYLYHEIADSLVKNVNRNKLIVGLAMMEALAGHKVLILLKRREHCNILMEKLAPYSAYYADSDDKERNNILMKMRSGEYNFSILVGTVSLLGCGCDVPALDRLILACDMKTDVGLQQASGRILRWFTGKESAKIYDLQDNKNHILRRQGLERLKFYKQCNWELSGVDWFK